jgi:hypothetical protein
MSTNTILASAPLTATGYHLKATGTALGQSLIWDNGTNVGIGNTNTSYTLDVSGTGRYNGSATTMLSVISSATASGLELKNTGGTASNWIIQSDGGAVAGQAALRFYSITASAYRMSIDGSGNVGIGTTTPTNGKLEIQTGVTTAGLWVQTGGTTSSYVIADFRTGTNLSALKILGNGSSEFGGSLTVGKLFSNYNGSQFINTSSGLVNYIDLSTIMSNHDSAIISIGQGNDNKLAKATVIVQRTAYTSGVTYSVATLGTQPIAAYLSFAISGSYLQMQTTSANATYYYNALVIPAYS